jgi:hypothetical protein
MSNKNRVNPDYYRQAGRDPQGETLNQERQKQLLARERASRPPSSSGNFIPGGDRAPAPKGGRHQALAAKSLAAPKAADVAPRRRPKRRARKTTRPTTTTAARGKTTTRRTTTRRASRRAA